MIYTVFDIETDGLKPTLIHCLSYAKYNNLKLLEKNTLTNYDDISNFIINEDIIVGHNIIRYDIPVLERLLGIEIKAKIYDTLGISWYLNPISKFKHGLEAQGVRYDYKKSEVDDWKTQPIKVYIERCEADVEINTRMFHDQYRYLYELYEHNEDNLYRVVGYTNFKLDCLKDQEDAKIDLDVRLAEETKHKLEFLIDRKLSVLKKFMPKIISKEIPKIFYKKDKSISAHGLRWLELLEELDLHPSTKVIYEAGNPSSTKQMKDWLFSLGWKPDVFKKNDKGERVPQIMKPMGEGEVTDSIKELAKEYTFLKSLTGLTILQHRLTKINAFLKHKDENNKVYATAHSLTSTLRLNHSSPCENLPKPSLPYGKEIRGCLTVPNNDYLMVGSDVSGLEDNMKQHFIYFYDPEYVREMRIPGFDNHVDIAILANLVKKEDGLLFMEIKAKGDSYTPTEKEKERLKAVKKVRPLSKQVNFSSIYGVGAKTVSESLKIPIKEAQNLLDVYWERNKAIKQFTEDLKVKTVRGQKWVYNPVSNFWNYLRVEKDRFSAVNQSAGDYFFNTWLKKVRKALKPMGIKVLGQWHDELMFIFPKKDKEIVKQILLTAIKETNEELKLNVELGISIDFGRNYAEVH